jgi:hypothetical protein
VDEAIREHLATEVLNPARIEAALDKAIAMLRTTEQMVPDRSRLTQRLRDVERTLASLTETATKGGVVPAVLEALNRADAERRALLDELKRGSLKPFSEKVPAGTFRDLRRTLRGYLLHRDAISASYDHHRRHEDPGRSYGSAIALARTPTY